MNSEIFGPTRNFLGSATMESFRGFNRSAIGSQVPIHIEGSGFVFIVKPGLNLTTANVLASSRHHWLNSVDPDASATAIRASLSPAVGAIVAGHPREWKSNAVDEENPFICILTNQCISLDGWPDKAFDSYTSEEGLAKEQYGYITAHPDSFRGYDLNYVGQGQDGNPIGAMRDAWAEYSAAVYVDRMGPFPRWVAEKVLDYPTRIYHFALGSDRKKIQKSFQTGYSFLKVGSSGAAGNYSREVEYNAEINTESLPFKCFGCYHNDPVTLDNFNKTVEYFNPAMATANKSGMHKLTGDDENYFDGLAIPYINIEKTELDWYVKLEVYNEIKGGAI